VLRSLAPALTAGNAVVVKLASYTPRITYELIRIFSEIEGILTGVVSLVYGSGSVVGPELCTNSDVDGDIGPHLDAHIGAIPKFYSFCFRLQTVHDLVMSLVFQ